MLVLSFCLTKTFSHIWSWSLKPAVMISVLSFCLIENILTYMVMEFEAYSDDSSNDLLGKIMTGVVILSLLENLNCTKCLIVCLNHG